MEADAFLGLILHGEAERVVEALAPLTDAERSRLSRPVAELCRKLERGDAVEPPADAAVWRRQRQRLLGPPAEVLEAAALARYGVCPRSQLKLNRLWFFWNRAGEDRLFRVLRDRNPPFLSDWIGDVYDSATEQDPAQLRWPVVRELVREGLAETPARPGYVRAMAEYFVPRWGKVAENLSLRLLEDRGLLDDEVWRLFEVDIGRDAWFRKPEPRARGGKPEPIEAWGEALLSLSRGGHLDRARLLEAGLGSMSRAVLGSSTLTGVRRFVEALEPTQDELDEHQPELLRMLGSGEGPVAGFAVASLAVLQRAGRLDATGFLRAVPAVFEIAAKSHPLRALKVVEQVLSEGAPDDAVDEDSRRSALAALERALLHPSRDVQDRAVALLESLGTASDAPEDPELARVVETVMPALAPAAAQRLSHAAGIEAPPVAGDAVNAAEVDELRRRFESLPEDVRRVHGLGVNWTAAWPELPPPWQPAPGTVPVLANLERIQPVADWQELVDAASHAAEVVDSADELERLLAGLARFGTERPDGFERRTEALAKRIESGGGSEFLPRGLRGSWTTLAFDFRDLLMVWLRRKPLLFRYAYLRRGVGPFRFLTARLGEVQRRIEKGHTAPLLAEPTHAGGWIEPAELVARLAARGDCGADPADLVQALLRLAPDGRDQALRRAAGLLGTLAPLLRFALGGDERPGPRDRRNRLAWLAAARSRDPLGSAGPYLETLGLRGLRGLGQGPDGMEPAEIAWQATTVKRRSAWAGAGEWPHLQISVSGRTQPFGGEAPEIAWLPVHVRVARALRRWLGRALAEIDLPTASTYRIAESAWEPADLQAAWQVDWLRTLWPARTDAVLLAGIRWTMRRLDMAPSNTSPNHAYLAPLFDIDRPWTEIAYLAAVVAVMSRDTDARAAALDALIECIEDGRVHPEGLGDVVVRFFEPGWAKANRLTEALEEVSRVGPLHQLVVARVLDVLVAAWRQPPHGAHLVLQLLLDCLEALGEGPSDGVREVLTGIKGQSKSAKLAKQLRELKPSADGGTAPAAVAEAWRARLDRCEPTGNAS